MLPLLPLRRLPDRRPGNRITRERRIQIENDACIICLVEAGRWHAAAQLCGAAALDLDVDALGVRLGAVAGLCRVQGDDLVAQDVVAGREVGGHGETPRVVGRDERVGDPGAGVVAGDEGALGELGPEERGG